MNPSRVKQMSKGVLMGCERYHWATAALVVCVVLVWGYIEGCLLNKIQTCIPDIEYGN